MRAVVEEDVGAQQEAPAGIASSSASGMDSLWTSQISTVSARYGTTEVARSSSAAREMLGRA